MKFLVSLLISLALMHHAHSTCVYVQSGDTCAAIESRNGCAIGSIVANNRGVNSDCTNLAIGQQVCCYASGAYSNGNAYPGTYAGTSNTCTYVAAGESCNAVESRMGWVKGSIVASTGGVNSGCTNLAIGQYVCGYYTGNYNTNGCYTVLAGDTCASIEARYGWAAGTIIGNNARINAGCTNLYPGDSVCGYYRGTYTNQGTATGCAYVQPGEGCNSVESRMGWAAGSIISSSNGAVNSACTNLQVGQYVCGYGYNNGFVNNGVVNNGVVNNGVVNNGVVNTGNSCSRYTIVLAGQTCDSIAYSLGISSAALVSTNPSLGYNCAGLYAGQMLCF